MKAAIAILLLTLSGWSQEPKRQSSLPVETTEKDTFARFLFESCQALVRDANKTSRGDDYISDKYCMGYIAGYMDSNALLGRICISGVTTDESIADVYVRYMEKHPEAMSLDMQGYGFKAAMLAHYPCTPKKPKR